jgi:undecaprenyl-diphosphatase
MPMDFVFIFIAKYFYIFSLLIGIVYFLLQTKAIKKSMLICGVIIAPLAFAISKIAGILYYNPRPFVVENFTPLIAHAANNGFPSDHVLLTGAIATVIWFYNKKLGIALWLLALLIGFARVYCGVHHTLDIIGSIVIVLFSGLVYYFVVRKEPVAKI